MARRWYVVRTKPQSEYLAAAALERDGFELFFPHVRTPRPNSGRDDVPLFPGYLFLRHDVEKLGWPSMERLPGILGWVRFSGQAPPVPDEVVSELAQRVDAINSTGGLWTRFRPGERVRVISGSMESLARVVDEPRSPQERVRVLVDFMGRQVLAQVPWRDLQRTHQDPLATPIPSGRRTRGRGRWIDGFGPRASASA